VPARVLSSQRFSRVDAVVGGQRRQSSAVIAASGSSPTALAA